MRAILFLLAACPALFGAAYTYSVDGQLVSADYGTQKIWYEYDDSGNLSSARGPTPLETWRKTNFSTFDSTGAAADAAITNGVPNIVRFALGVPSGAMLDSRMQYASSTGGLDVTYWVRSDMPTLAVTLEVSTDLKTWTPFAGAVKVGAETSYDLWKTTLPTNQPRIFWRVKTNNQP